MALNCQVVRNKTTNEIEYVTAPNGKRSNLFRSIKEAHPGITDERALRHYARFYTDEFRKSWGDFVALSEGKIKKLEPRINNELAYTIQIELDENYEPVYDDPMLKFMQNYAMGLESKGIDSVNRMDEELSLGAQKHAEYNEKLRAALIDFLKGLNIDVDENADGILENLYDDNNPIAAFDMINKYLGLHSTIDTGRFTLQVAAIVYEMLGKKTKLSIDIYKNIDKWDAYQTLYDYYNSKEFDNFRDDKNPIGDAEDLGVEYEKDGELVRLALQVYEVGPIANNLIWGSAKKTIKNLVFKDKPFNYWAHKQVIYHFLAEALEYGYQTEYKGPKIKNETINKDYFEKFGWKESPRFVKNIFKKIWNWFYNKIIMQGLLGNIPFAKVSQQDLYDMANSIADDVYKKDYSNIMQQAHNINGEFYNTQGERLEQKFYEETLESDPFAGQIIATLFGLEGFGFTEEKGKQLQSLYKLSGSQVIRRYGFLLRSMSESLHDIDGIIPLEVFEAEENKQEILDFLEGPGLKLEEKRKGPKFAKEFEKLLNKQSWYQKLKEVFPDFVYENAFMGNAKKTQEYVTITGYVEHPTEMEVDKNTGLPRKKRYVLDFFLRTKPGNYPQRFDDTYYSWKQIYEAKVKMGRAKDMNDHILFIPYVTEGTKYVFRNKGFRLMTFEPIAADLQAMIKKSSKNQAVQMLNSKSKFSKGIDPEQATNILDQKNRLLSLNQVKALVAQVGRDITDENFITAEQAAEMTKYSENPWSGQAAFYFNDKIYFVGNNITAKTAVHEISHPLIRSIKENNPDLYNNLVRELLSTKEGRDLVEEIMIEQEEGRNPNNPVDMEWAALEIPKGDIPDIVLEEAMVRVLNEKYFMDDAQLTPEFNRFIKKIWFHIKQLLRKIFKTDVSKLSPSTTIEDLALMLKKGDKFDAPVTSVGMEDIVAYSDDLTKHIENITKAYRNDKIKLQESIDKHYNAIQKQLNVLNSLKKSDPELYEQIIAPMANPHNRNYLHEMATSIRPWTSAQLVKAQNEGKITKSELEIFRAKTKTLLDTLLQLRELTDQSLKHLRLLAQNPDTASTIIKVMEYKNFQQFWAEYIDEAIIDLKEVAGENFSNNNPTIQILTATQANINDMKSVIQKINAEYVGDYVADFMEPMNQMANEQYEKRKKEYEQKIEENPEAAEYYKEALKREKKLRDRRIVTPDKVKLLLAGALTEDVNGIMDRYITNFIGQSDPIVGTLAATLKNAKNALHAQALRDKNEFLQEINPYLEKLGISGANYQTLADKLLFNDNIGYVNEDGNYEDYEARTLLNPHVGAKAYVLNLQMEEKKAKQEWYANKNEDTEKAYLDAIKKKELVTSLFYNRKYIDEIYDLQKELMNVTREVNGKIENVGLMAYEKTQQILDEIAELTPALPDPFKTHENYERIDLLWNEYSKLFSFKDDFGRDKDDLNMAIAEVLIENRKKNKNYYEYNPIPGAFATSYNSVKSKVILEMTEEGFDQNAKPEEFHEELNERMQMWVDLNTRQIPKESWYTDRARILQVIQQVFEDLAKQRADVLAEDPTLASDFEASNELALIVKEINKNLTGRRDDDGHPKGDDMTEEQLAEIKRLHELKESSKTAVMNLMGLTGEEMERMQEYWDILRRRKKKERDFNGKLVGLTEFEQEDYDFLKTKSDKLGISKIQKNKLFKALQELDDMQERLPTKYYTDIAENWYQRLIRPVLVKTLEGKKVATSVQEEDFLDPSFIDQFLEMDEEFKEWFESSHYETTVYQKGSAPQKMYARIDAWNIVRPSDPKDYESIKIYDEHLEKDIFIVGQPGKQFWRREVKPEFWTGYDPNTGQIELKVGEHIDNRGFFMPKSLEAMEAKYQKDPDQFTEDMPYNMFINQDYYNLKNSTNEEDKVFFELLEIIKKYNLKWQEDITEPSQRLMHELARYRPDNYEVLKTTEKDSNRLTSKFNRWKEKFLDDYWRVSSEDFEDNLNYDNAFTRTVAEHNLNFERNNIPLGGVYKMDIQETSMDIIDSLLKFRIGILEHKALKETSPIADAIHDLVNNFDESKIKDLKRKYTNDKLVGLGYDSDDKKKFGKTNRKAIVNALYEINWKGQRTKGDTKKWIRADKLINATMGLASHAFFSLDFVSGFKNYFGAQFQLRQEALFNDSGIVSYQGALLGEAWALNTMRLISQEVYTRGPNHINIQLTDLFDFAQGRFNEKYADNVTRDIYKDIFSLSWTTSQRKWFELLASMEFFSAAMHTVKVDRKVGDQVEVLNYIDAWEIDPETNDIKLKSGIDKKYAPGGSEFNRIKNAIHEYQNFNQGAYAAAEQGALSQYVLARPFLSMRRFFPKMFMRRLYADTRMKKSLFNFSALEEHWNPALQKFEMGYWARSARALSRITFGRNQHPGYKLTKEDWLAMGRTAADPIKAYLWMWMWLTIFGIDWDPEDPDKWKKIKARSGAMPGPWTVDDPKNKFNTWGFIQNQALLIALNTDAENKFFNPPLLTGPKSMYDWFRMFQDFSISAQSVENTLKLMNYGWQAGSDKGYYKRDSGQITYRQAGAWKGERILYKTLGFKPDKLFDPEQATRDLWGAINR